VNQFKTGLYGLGLATFLVNGVAEAHDPVFGIGPHVLFKGGVEIAPEIHTRKKGGDRDTELGLELTYGITGDWAAGIELPYARALKGDKSSSGLGDASLFTKYRFWRKDSLGLQRSATVLLKLKANTAANKDTPALGTGSTDAIFGLAYGYESRKWYHWAGARYRKNGTNAAGLRRGDKILLDLVGGIRPKLTGYLEPDTVWLLELNGELGQRAERNGFELGNTGGTEVFLSPGIFWTKRNFAIKAGVQIPIYQDLNGDQKETDYRAKVVFEWHL